MTKLYSMDEHSYAIKQQFSVEITSPHEQYSCNLVGFNDVLSYLYYNKTSLTLDEMFRIFIDNLATKHIVLQLDPDGEIETCIKITLENE